MTKINKGIKCTLNKLSDDTNVSGVIGTPEGWNDIQRDLDKWEMARCCTYAYILSTGSGGVMILNLNLELFKL